MHRRHHQALTRSMIAVWLTAVLAITLAGSPAQARIAHEPECGPLLACHP